MLTLRRTARRRHPDLHGETVVVLGASTGVGLEIARRARAEGADVILTDSDRERLRRATLEVGARSAAAFEAGDRVALRRFFDGLPGPIDHVVVTAEGPHDEAPLDMEPAGARALALDVARSAVGGMRPGGTLLLADGTGSAFTAALAAALAPVRVRVAPVATGLAEPDDVAARAVRAMLDTPLTGATDDRQLLARAA